MDVKQAYKKSRQAQRDLAATLANEYPDGAPIKWKRGPHIQNGRVTRAASVKPSGFFNGLSLEAGPGDGLLRADDTDFPGLTVTHWAPMPALPSVVSEHSKGDS